MNPLHQNQPQAVPGQLYHQQYVSLHGYPWGPYTTGEILNALATEISLCWVSLRDHNNEVVAYCGLASDPEYTRIEVKFPASVYHGHHGWLHVSSADPGRAEEAFQTVMEILDAMKGEADARLAECPMVAEPQDDGDIPY